MEKGRLKPGETVLVTGASGGVGLASCVVSKALGCRVVAVTTSEAKAEALAAAGADEVVVAVRRDDGTAAFSRHPAARGIDLVMECVGEPTFGDALRSLRPGGRLVLVGNVTKGMGVFPLGLSIIRGLSIIGSDSVRLACGPILLFFLGGGGAGEWWLVFAREYVFVFTHAPTTTAVVFANHGGRHVCLYGAGGDPAPGGSNDWLG